MQASNFLAGQVTLKAAEAATIYVEGGQITRKVQVGVDSSETTYEAGWIGPFHFLIRTRSPPPPLHF